MRGFVLVLVACGARTPIADESPIADAAEDVTVSHDASRDVALDVPASLICANDAGAVGANACTRTITLVSLTKSMSSCFVDVIPKLNVLGKLAYDCNGGNARASFSGDSRVFAGPFDGTMLDVCMGTRFPWSDGCMWHSSQEIRGRPSDGTMTFSYIEAPDNNMGCAPPCTATGVISVGP